MESLSMAYRNSARPSEAATASASAAGAGPSKSSAAHTEFLAAPWLWGLTREVSRAKALMPARFFRVRNAFRFWPKADSCIPWRQRSRWALSRAEKGLGTPQSASMPTLEANADRSSDTPACLSFARCWAMVASIASGTPRSEAHERHHAFKCSGSTSVRRASRISRSSSVLSPGSRVSQMAARVSRCWWDREKAAMAIPADVP
mmetsp:Transcript_1673/g.5715  ORF Transcript_1673/g.5715 Transcript_1673/m.5715 type:complete len:204 (-) Transcript_1673:64-675(-)